MQDHTNARFRTVLSALIVFHLVVIAASNFLVQLPLSLWGLHTTWGALSFPFIFLATDLTVRLFGAAAARRIILKAMIPALFLSYLLSVLFYQGVFQGVAGLYELNVFVARIAFASFLAYVLGQLLDVQVFDQLRRKARWWIAPAASTVLGSALDTLIFFSAAFYRSSDAFMAEHWTEIALVDYAFKLGISLLFFLPLYGILMVRLVSRLTEIDRISVAVMGHEGR